MGMPQASTLCVPKLCLSPYNSLHRVISPGLSNPVVSFVFIELHDHSVCIIFVSQNDCHRYMYRLIPRLIPRHPLCLR